MPADNLVRPNAHTTQRLMKWQMDSLEYMFHKGDLTVYRDTDEYERKLVVLTIVHHRAYGDYKVGTLQLHKEREGYRVDYMALSRRYQGLGVGEWLYGCLLKAGVILVSGSSQSPGAKSLWSKLMEKFESNCDVDDLYTNRRILLWA